MCGFTRRRIEAERAGFFWVAFSFWILRTLAYAEVLLAPPMPGRLPMPDRVPAPARVPVPDRVNDVPF